MAILLKLSAVFYLITFLAKSASCNGLENFVEYKLEEYPEWIKENNFDPSPLTSGPTLIRAENVFAKLFGTLSDHGVQGHAQGIDIELVTVNLQSAEILASFTLQGDIKFFGRYTASGTLVPSDTALEGDGSWYMQVPSIHFQNVTMSWVTTSTGHLSITKFKFPSVKLPAARDGMEMYFENLWEDDPTAVTFEQVIKESIYLAFQDSLTKSAEHSIKKMLIQYFQQIFADTPLSEIIAVTRAVSTSSTHTPPTTTSATSTSLPTESDNDGKWQLSRGMIVLLFLWVVAIVMMAVMIIFIAKMFMVQTRYSKRMGATLSPSPQSVHVDYISDHRNAEKQ